MLVGNLIERAGTNQVQEIDESISVHNALYLLTHLNVRSLLVKKDKHVVGMFFEKDCARQLLLRDLYITKTRVEEVMTRNIVFADYNMSIEKCLELMTFHKMKQLPVQSNGTCTGFVSLIEVVQQLLRDRDFMIDQLNKYISGSPLTNTADPTTSFKNAS